jgi:hypothetical protein
MPEVARVEYFRIPPEMNVTRNVGRLMVNDMTGLIIAYLK